MLLTALFVGHQSEWVFTDEYGDRLSYEAVRYQTQRACQEAKVEYRGMHVFRHTFATNCYHKKVDIKIYQDCLGTPIRTLPTTYMYISTVTALKRCMTLLQNKQKEK